MAKKPAKKAPGKKAKKNWFAFLKPKAKKA